jgi:hypothetical protein
MLMKYSVCIILWRDVIKSRCRATAAGGRCVAKCQAREWAPRVCGAGRYIRQQYLIVGSHRIIVIIIIIIIMIIIRHGVYKIYIYTYIGMRWWVGGWPQHVLEINVMSHDTHTHTHTRLSQQTATGDCAFINTYRYWPPQQPICQSVRRTRLESRSESYYILFYVQYKTSFRYSLIPLFEGPKSKRVKSEYISVYVPATKKYFNFLILCINLWS